MAQPAPPPVSLRPVPGRLVALGHHDRAGGFGLVVGTIAALAWANLAGAHGYEAFWGHVAPWSHALGLHLTWRDWVNDAVMVAFFGLVGLEIRREVTTGELGTWRRAAAPVVAAAIGMAVPALLYLAIVHGGPGAKGWGVPMATDVAFALGALALVARGASPRTRMFLMTLAVADDIGSLVILVAFYSEQIGWSWLLGGLAALGALVVASKATRAAGPGRRWAIGAAWVAAAVMWWALVHAGVEPAVVGVALGLAAPGVPHAAADRSPSDEATPAAFERDGTVPPGELLTEPGAEVVLEPWVNLAVLPLFALANAGLRLAGAGLGERDALVVFVAVVVARVVGKAVGLGTAGWVLRRGRGGRFDPGLASRTHLGLGALASTGFTVPLLIIRVALHGRLASAATAGLLVATVLGVALAAVLFRWEAAHQSGR